MLDAQSSDWATLSLYTLVSDAILVYFKTDQAADWSLNFHRISGKG